MNAPAGLGEYGLVAGVVDLDPLLLWRPEVQGSAAGLPKGLISVATVVGIFDDAGYGAACDYCGEATLFGERSSGEEAVNYENTEATACGFCGWGSYSWFAEDIEVSDSSSVTNALGVVDLSAPDVEMAELKTVIASRPERAIDMSPRRFEELVGEVFRSGGYEVELTRATRDGGRDLVLMRAADDVSAIVEVKRYRGRVGVELVRHLRGVQVADGVPHAILVAASGFTSGAIAEAARPIPRSLGFSMELLDLNDLMDALGVLAEPRSSPSAMARSRDAYRAWQASAFGPPPADLRRPKFPRLEHHPWKRRWPAPEIVGSLEATNDA